MKNPPFIGWLIVSLLICQSCSIGSQAIDFGADECNSCKMIIADKHFGCELVTAKGRVYKYDAIECLLPEVIKNGEDHYGHILIVDHQNPKEFIDARKAYYLISKQLPSPMGAYLSGYTSNELAEKVKTELSGEIFNWNSILVKFKK